MYLRAGRNGLLGAGGPRRRAPARVAARLRVADIGPSDESDPTAQPAHQRSEWRFKGHVRIVVESALLEADTAVFTFEKEQLARGELDGNPASFTDRDPTRQKPVSGGARKLYYDYTARTLRMSENAYINKDQYEIQGCDLIYDFTDERVTSGSADCGELFRIRVLPQTEQQTSPADTPQ
jgi:lipopolysaccharide transport protein LptA